MNIIEKTLNQFSSASINALYKFISAELDSSYNKGFRHPEDLDQKEFAQMYVIINKYLQKDFEQCTVAFVSSVEVETFLDDLHWCFACALGDDYTAANIVLSEEELQAINDGDKVFWDLHELVHASEYPRGYIQEKEKMYKLRFV